MPANKRFEDPAAGLSDRRQAASEDFVQAVLTLPDGSWSWADGPTAVLLCPDAPRRRPASVEGISAAALLCPDGVDRIHIRLRDDVTIILGSGSWD